MSSRYSSLNKAYICSIPSQNDHASLVCDKSEHKNSIDQRGTLFGKLTIFPYQDRITFERQFSLIRTGQSKMDTQRIASVLLSYMYLIDIAASEDALCYNR